MKRAMAWGFGVGLTLLMAGGAKAAGKEPAIGGYCPVAYAKMGKAVPGDPRWASERDGQTFLFSGAQAKDLFDRAPDQFRIAYRGYCATGVAMGKKIASNPKIFTVWDGVTYLFSNADAKAMFDKDPATTVAKAERAWPSLR